MEQAPTVKTKGGGLEVSDVSLFLYMVYFLEIILTAIHSGLSCREFKLK